MNFNNLLKTFYPSLLIFICATAFTIFAYHQVSVATKNRREKLFEQRVDRATETLRARVIDYIQILRGCQSLFYASDTVSLKEWKSYITNLNLSANYPGIQAVAFAHFIKREHVGAFEETIRKTVHPGFKIDSDFKRSYLTPIVFIEPFTGRNLRAFGFDMFSEENRRNAMEKAMRSGEAALSNKVILRQETDEDVQPGFLLYLPVYKSRGFFPSDKRTENLLGFVYQPFRAYDLMNAILRKNYGDLYLQVYDGGQVQPDKLLYSSGTIRDDPAHNTEFRSVKRINVAGVQWTILALAPEDFGSSIERYQPFLVLVFGLLVTSLIVLISVNEIRHKADLSAELNLTKELEKKKDEFIGIASHELKTPLTSIKGYIQLLQRAHLSEAEQNLVRKANTQVKKLNNLIADLLDVSKIQAGHLQLNLSSFTLKEMILDCKESVQNMYPSHDILLEEPIPDCVLMADKFRVEQALTNLLINAIKYSPGKNSVYISTAVRAAELELKVRDEGIGISYESQKKIFEKFFRAEDLHSSFSGLGMGLFISNEIVRRHNGRISVESELGKGSVFTIYLPLNNHLETS